MVTVLGESSFYVGSEIGITMKKGCLMRMTAEKYKSGIAKNVKAIILSVYRAFSFCAAHCPAYLALNIVMSIVNVLSPYVVLMLWRHILDVIGENLSAVWLFVGLYMLVQLICQLLSVLQVAYQQSSRDKVDQILKSRIIHKLADIELGKYDDPEFHRLFSVLNRIPDYSRLVDDCLNVISSLLSLIITIAALVHGYLAAAVLILVFQIPTVIILSYNAINAYKLWAEENDDRRRIGYYRNVMTNSAYAKEIRLYDLGGLFFGLYNRYWAKLYHSAMRLQKKGAIRNVLGNLVGMIGFTFLISTLIAKAYSGTVTAGDIYYYIGLGVVLMSNTESFGFCYSQLYNDAKQCGEILDEYLAIESGMKQGTKVLTGTPEIEFRDVSFKYPGSEDFVLRHISFKLSAGEKMLLAGINGSGKTTIVKLLLRMYDPTEGVILYNGIPAKEYDLHSLRACFGVSFQTTELYARSFRKNVEISKMESGTESRDIYESALEMSGADKVRSKLQNFDDTELTRSFDEKGYEPSGGERQRIGLARAYYREACFVILDEPSSAQDAIAEDHIFSAFLRAYSGKSAILISHRMSVASIVDKIALIENGQLLAFGTHAEVYRSNDRYHCLYDMQASGYCITEDSECK